MPAILLVEDNASNAKLASFLLRSAGYEIFEAADGQAALRMAREERPQLVLMDVHLPGMDGLEITRRLKADPQTAAIPVIALTASAMAGDEHRILRAGCDGYVSKPFDYRDLLHKVAAVLGAGARVPTPQRPSGEQE